MKRVISLILAIVMIALLAPMAISADEIKTVDASAPADAEAVKADQVTITKKYFAVSYTMNYAEKAGKDGNNGCNGIILGGGDGVGCVFLPYDGVKDGQKVANKALRFGPWWPSETDFGKKQSTVDASAYVGKEVTILLVGSYENKKLTVKAYLNGNAVKAWGADEFVTENFNGKLGWATKLAGQKATFKFVESDKALDKTAFEPKAPTTGVKVGPVSGSWKVEGKTYIHNAAREVGKDNIISLKDAAVYVLGKSNDFELTAKIDATDKECGFIINGKDVDGNGYFSEEEGKDQFIVIWMKGPELRVITSDTAFNKYGDNTNEQNWGACRIPTAQGEFELKLVYKNYTVEVFVNGQKAGERVMDKGHEFGGWIGTWSKDQATYKDVNLTVHDAQKPPKTGEATAIVAVIAVLTLAGTMVAAKKRH